MGKAVFKPDNAGFRELLKSAGVRDHLTERAQRVLSAAQAGATEGMEYEIVQGTTDRARVSIGTRSKGALFIEAKTGNLIRALDAAR